MGGSDPLRCYNDPLSYNFNARFMEIRQSDALWAVKLEIRDSEPALVGGERSDQVVFRFQATKPINNTPAITTADTGGSGTGICAINIAGARHTAAA